MENMPKVKLGSKIMSEIDLKKDKRPTVKTIDALVAVLLKNHSEYIECCHNSGQSQYAYSMRDRYLAEVTKAEDSLRKEIVTICDERDDLLEKVESLETLLEIK